MRTRGNTGVELGKGARIWWYTNPGAMPLRSNRASTPQGHTAFVQMGLP